MVVFDMNIDHWCKLDECLLIAETDEIYKKYADQLVQSGWAYIAFDTPEGIDERIAELLAQS